MNILEQIKQKAAALQKTIVLCEGEDSRVVKAAQDATREGIAKIGIEDFAKVNGLSIYTDKQQELYMHCDAVYIASPNVCHFSQSKLFLENGINVLCEKPAARILSEALEKLLRFVLCIL